MKMTLTGDKELISQLKNLRGSGQRRAAKTATTFAMLPLKQSSKAEAPRDTGQLSKSLASKTKSYASSGTVIGLVGVKKDAKNQKTGRNPSKYLHLVTKGTQPHNITPKNKRALKIGDRLVSIARHKGAKANNFLLRAFDSGKSAALARFQSKLAERITIEARKG